MTLQPAGLLHQALDAALAVPASTVRLHVDQTRRSHPGASDDLILRALDRRFLATVAASGAAAGAAAAAPGVGTPAALALAGGDVVSFTVSSALLALGYAEVHGVPVTDLERRRMLVMAVMLGDSGAATIAKAAGRTGAHWGRQATAAIPMSTIRQINRVLGRNFVTKYGAKQGVLVLGKALPFGAGAGIGAGGNLAFGMLTVRTTRLAFGPVPPPDGQFLAA